MKNLMILFAVVLSSSFALAEPVLFSAPRGSSLVFPSIVVSSVALDLSKADAPTLIVEGTDFSAIRLSATLARHNEDRFDALAELELPVVKDGRNCGAYEAVKLRLVAPYGALAESEKLVEIAPIALTVLGVREFTENVCEFPVQTETIPYLVQPQ